MGLAETAQLAVNLDLKGNFNKGIGTAQKNLKQMSGQTDTFRTRLRRLGTEAKGSILSGVGLGAGLVGFQLLSSAVSSTIDVLGNSVKMAAEEEAAIAQLTKAIEANDDAWDGNIDAVENLITARQALAFSDGEQRESLQLLVGATKDVTEAQELLGTAMDFARFRNISLKTSADLLGRAYAGNFGTLSRYGVVLEEGATATEALAQIQDLAEGQARAYADTTQGKLVRAQIALDDAMEDLGRTITPIVADFAGLAAETIPQVVTGVQELVGEISQALGEAEKAYQDFRDTVHETVGRDVENDIANFARAAGSFGVLPIVDKTNELGFGLSDLQRGLQDVQRATVGVTEDTAALQDGYDVLSSIVVRTTGTIEESAQRTVLAGNGIGEAFRIVSRSALSAARAVATEVQQLHDFKDAADDIAETRGIAKINKELREQFKARRRAAAAGKTAAFAQAQANINQLQTEKNLRRLGNAARKDFVANKTAERRKQGEVTQSLRETTSAAKALDRVDPKVTVTTPGLGGALSRIGEFGALAAGLARNVAFSPPPKFATGTNFVNRDGLAFLHRGEQVLTRDKAIRDGGGAMPSIFIAPVLEVAAAQVERRTTQAVRANRYRANT